jgi:hypothetical protein
MGRGMPAHRSKERRGLWPLIVGRSESGHRVDDSGAEKGWQDAHREEVAESLGEEVGTGAVCAWGMEGKRGM